MLEMVVKVRSDGCQKKLKVENKNSEADLKLNLDSDVKSKMTKGSGFLNLDE